MTAIGIAAAVVLAGIAGFSGWQAFQLWRDPRYVSRMMLAGSILPFSKDVRRGAVRGALPLSVGVALAAAGLLAFSVSRPAPGHPTARAIVAVVFFGLMLVAFGCHFAIIWFNRPRWLVPPHMRAEGGMAVARWRPRRGIGRGPGGDDRRRVAKRDETGGRR
jgi:hypothetical protein